MNIEIQLTAQPVAGGSHVYKYIQVFYVNTQLYMLLMQLYFALGDMFRLLKQPSSCHVCLQRDCAITYT